jgi:hypothetical protein
MATCVAWRALVVAQLRIYDPLEFMVLTRAAVIPAPTNKEEPTNKENFTNKEDMLRADLPLKLTKGMA